VSPAAVAITGHQLTAAHCSTGGHDLRLHQYHHLGTNADTHPRDGQYWATCSCGGPRQTVAGPGGAPWCRTYAEVCRLVRQHLAAARRPVQLALFT